ncbi:MAG TPA: nicotinate-nicotinamide nucleotide adenylyltransferase [Candidatus Solibacter sp.]|jgi:nicotinate (nicotinamide) nucleotide adenylyltransferase
MEFFRRATGRPTRLAVFPGSFNPVTVAHISLAEAALNIADEVVFVLPRIFPHKIYAGASFEERIELLCLASGDRAGFSIAASEGGLFVEIAEECRRAYGDIQLSFLCGRDAAERIANWDYGEPGAFEAMLRQFDFLVAERSGRYLPEETLRASFTALDVPTGLDHVSASEIRARLARGEQWEHLVPPAVQQRVREIYRQANPTEPEGSG